MGSVPVCVDRAFHELPPFDSWLCQDVCWMRVHLTPFLRRAIICWLFLGFQSHLPCQIRLVLLGASFSFGRRGQISSAFSPSPSGGHFAGISLFSTPLHSLWSVVIWCAGFTCNISSRMPSACLCLDRCPSLTFIQQDTEYACPQNVKLCFYIDLFA